MTSSAAKTAAANKRKGAKWESELREGLRAEGFDVESLRLAGAEDEGDMVVRLNTGRYLVIEAKSGKMDPGTFVKEAAIERANFAKHRGLDLADVDHIVVVKRRGAGWKRAYVLETADDYFDLAGR